MIRPVTLIVYGLIVLGIIGIGSRLFTDPIGALKSMLIFAIVLGVVVFIVKRLTKDHPNKRDQKAYSKAVRNSKKRLKQRDSDKKTNKVASFSLAQKAKKVKTKTKSETHLTVIEGKKGKKKNRAFF
ncbi:SA1362 family protein [Peribacillus acanthi]|uniref:SA1362 family protein n=1 Tax=Peribacillus acanthi TaxID=2171554 RepID=UPI000D3E1BBE|nr:SA1362 family protein [Peribacillus acanthi]